MSIYFDFDVGPKGRRFRRAVDGDKADVEEIWRKHHSDNLFNIDSVGHLIELSSLAICMINENKEVTGFIALSDHPNLPAVDPSDWETWIRNMYLRYYTSHDTIFVHFMCCLDEVADDFYEEAILAIFNNDPYLLHILLFVSQESASKHISRYQTFKKRNFFKYYPKNLDDIGKGLVLYVARRQEFCPKLKIRRAVEEDNDDIVEILNKTCPKLVDLYGAYYLSEIVGRRPESHRRIIVAENQDRAVGVMCLNTEINYTMLENTYEIKPYFGLRKATALEKEQLKRNNNFLRIFGEPVMRGEWSPFHNVPKLETLRLDDEPSREQLHRKSRAKVNFGDNAVSRRSYDLVKSKMKLFSEDFSDRLSKDSIDPVRISEDSEIFLEDDPFDYEIVNIDSHLLNLPKAVWSLDHIRAPSRDSRQRKSRTSFVLNNYKKLRRLSSFKQVKPVNTQTMYCGGPNAFMIELFGLREDIDPRHAFDFLEVAFELMKQYDYCIVSVPCDNKSFPLLQHFCFVPTKINVYSGSSLYIVHRSSFLGRLRVRKAEIIDIPQISQFLQNMDGKETLWLIENSLVNTKDYSAYIFTSGAALVGFGILEPAEQIDFIRSKVSMEPYRNTKYYYRGNNIDAAMLNLKTLLIYPTFEAHFRFFARELMRLSNSASILWLTAYNNKLVTHKTNSIVSKMIPLMPRSSEIDCAPIPEIENIDLSKSLIAFSSWYIDKKFTSLTKVNVDSRIVVVGASRTAMAFLNELLFGNSTTYLTFNNVTLISPNGLPYSRHPHPCAEFMFMSYRKKNVKYLKSVPYTYYVNVIEGTMTEINRHNKYITTANGYKFYYDILVLLIGKQYQHPEYMKSVKEKESMLLYGKIPPYIRLDNPSYNDETNMLNYETPENVFIINNAVDATKALEFVEMLENNNTEYKIIVYGATFTAYFCIATLEKMKIPFDRIIFVEPFPPEDTRKMRVPVFNNSYVDQAVRKVLATSKVKIYSPYYFQSWDTDFNHLVTHVNILSAHQMIKLECSMLFYYGKRGINSNAFTAIHKSGIPYEGGILIDHKFMTKDPSVFAAGPITRYYRRYRADSYRQKYFDSEEIGQKFGKQIKNMLDPLFFEKKHSNLKYYAKNHRNIFKNKHTSFSSEGNCKKGSMSSEESLLYQESLKSIIELQLPDLKKPIVVHGNLPGGLQYLEVKPPGLRMPHHYVQSLDYTGLIMETFKEGYFKLHLNSEFIVDGITCLTLGKLPIENFKNLFGKSAVLLNNVYLRYNVKQLDNFYEFFRSPWAFFMYHDQAEELFMVVKELTPTGKSQAVTLFEALQTLNQNIDSHSFSIYKKINLQSLYSKSPYVEAITAYVIEWLSENEVMLPMYLQPMQGIQYTYDTDHNPYFRKKKHSVRKMMSMIL